MARSGKLCGVARVCGWFTYSVDEMPAILFVLFELRCKEMSRCEYVCC